MRNFKKACTVALLAAGMVLGATAGAHAVDFKAKGEWLVGFGLGDGNFTQKGNDRRQTTTNDYFGAGQRVRLQLDAVASEALSGTVWFEIGTQEWGKANQGGALGADGNNVIKVKNAYLDWIVPQTDLKLRMGIQAVKLPSAAGGTAIFDADVAGITASYQFNDNVGLTAFWYRPLNDNDNGTWGNPYANYLDNLDLFGLALPLTFDGVKATPWIMYGAMGRNALRGYGGPANAGGWTTADGQPNLTLSAAYNNMSTWLLNNGLTIGRNHAYSNMFFAGLPVVVNAWDPLNIEFDFNYGYVEGFGRGDAYDFRASDIAGAIVTRRANTRRSGWLVKALVEYKLDWGIPGIFGWYASGDDGNIRNGCERLPVVAGGGNFTSFMGAGGGGVGADWMGYDTRGTFHEKNLSYAGTWGIGAQIRDMSFVEDLKHTFRIAYWGGTNSPKMTRYFRQTNAWANEFENGPYLTTNDGLLEFNLENNYKIYENLEVGLDLGYIVNMMNKGTWDRRWMDNMDGTVPPVIGAGAGSHYQKKDAWKAELIFKYSF